MGFRPDIQGMRAIAVLLVVGYHAGLPWVSGGFIGVDVFFVVSGYVIAGSLLRDLDTSGSVRIVRFYRRRFRRLMPAFLAMTTVTLALSALILDVRTDQPEAAKTALAATFSVPNLYLERSIGGYFAANHEDNPFLHTWSLGVEEQFYLLMPVVVCGVVALARHVRWPVRTIAATFFSMVVLASLALNLVWVADLRVQRAFYMPFSRFWELAVGVVAACVTSNPPRRSIATVVSAIGFAGIVAGAVAYDHRTVFPGSAATLPVAATVIVIVSAHGSPLVSRALSWKPLVWIGDRSYGWYLWHWPALVLAGELYGRSTLVLAAAATFSLVPTYVSYRWLEQPIRSEVRVPRSRRLPAMAAIAVVAAVAGSVVVQEGSARGWGRTIDWHNRDLVAFEHRCDDQDDRDVDRCTFGATESEDWILLVGDSHAASMSNGVVAAAELLDLRVVVVVAHGCPYYDVQVVKPTCPELRTTAWSVVASAQRPPVAAVVAHRAHIYVQPNQTGTFKMTAEDPDHRLAQWNRGVAAAHARFDAAGTEMILIETVPELFESNENARSRTPDEITQRDRVIHTVERAIVSRVVRPLDALCETERCHARDADGRLLYYDDSHLNRRGSLLVAPLIEAELRDLLTDRASSSTSATS